MSNRKLKGGSAARARGHIYEREVAQRWREHGFPECVTSRSESRNEDAKGVDLCFTGNWAVQCKKSEKLGNTHDIINSMPSDRDNVLFHKRANKGTMVVMSEELFWKMMRAYESKNLVGS